MDRRDFLKILLATPVAAAYDFEHLLWVPKPMVTVSEVKLYKPGDIFLEHWGEKFGFVDDRGKIHYIGAYKDVDKILNALYYKESIR
jgi:hypothetical protein